LHQWFFSSRVEIAMSDTEAKPGLRVADPRDTTNAGLPAAKVSKPRLGTVPLVITLAATALAVVAGALMWDAYMGAPWTRDATVRTYVVTMAPEVAGRIVQLPVKDNQFVHRGDLLVVIDPTDYKNALQSAEANVEQARATALNAKLELQRRQKLSDLAETIEDRQIHEANAAASQAQLQAAQVSRDQAKVNLERTQLRSPVNGWVTNLLTQVGDYASVGRNVISLVDADSFWIDAYFEETRLPSIQEGNPAKIKLMGHSAIILGEVGSLARGITVANAQPDLAGLANVNPIFTWVRLAQRVPVRINIKQLPDGIRLVTGLTATVQVEPRSHSSSR
jgi:multidrug resistance efflux pump